MAHECPDCGAVCYCGGDVDDMLLIGTEEEDSCGHCFEGSDGDDGGDYFDEDLDDDPALAAAEDAERTKDYYADPEDLTK